MSKLFYAMTFGSVGAFLNANENPRKTKVVKVALWSFAIVLFFFHAAFMENAVFPFMRFLVSSVIVFLVFSLFSKTEEDKNRSYRFAFTMIIWYIAATVFHFVVYNPTVVHSFSY